MSSTINQKSSQTPAAKPRFFYGYVIVTVAFIIMLAIFGINYSFGIFFKPILAEFGWTRAITTGAFSLAWIVTGLISIFMGALNDRLGPRVVLSLCGFLSGLGYVLMSQITSLWQLYLFYGVIIGAGISAFIPMVSTVARWFVRRRSMMTGIVAAGIGAGALIVPPLANLLIVRYQWRTSYMILGIIVIVVVILCSQFLKRDPAQTGQLPHGENEAIAADSNIEIAPFSLKEATRTRQFWMVFTMLFCSGFCLYAIQVHLAPHVTDAGISASTAATVLAAMGGASIVGRAVLGSIGDKIGNRQAYLMGYALIAAALLWLMASRELWHFYLFAVIFGLAYGNCDTQQSPLVAALFGLTSHGLIFGFIALGYSIGAALGPFVAGYIYDITSNYQMAFLICAIVGVAGIIVSVLVRPTREKGRQEIPT